MRLLAWQAEREAKVVVRGRRKFAIGDVVHILISAQALSPAVGMSVDRLFVVDEADHRVVMPSLRPGGEVTHGTPDGAALWMVLS